MKTNKQQNDSFSSRILTTLSYTMSSNRQLLILEVAILVLLAAILFAASASNYNSLDAYDNILGGKLILDGRLPYIDFFSHHSPGAYFLLAPLYFLTGGNIVAIQLVFNVLILSLHGLTYITLRKYKSHSAALFFALLIVFFHVFANSATVVGESLVAAIIPLVYAQAILIKRIRLLRLTLLSFLCATIPLLSLSYIVPIMPVYLLLLYNGVSHYRDVNSRVKYTLKVLLIFALPFMLSLLYVIATGSLPEMKYQLFTFNSSIYTAMSGDTTGGYIQTIFHTILQSLKSITGLIANILNPAYWPTLVILLGYITLIAILIKQRLRLSALALTATLLVINIRVNRFHPSAISTPLGEVSHHSAVYIVFGLFCFALAIAYLIESKNRTLLKIPAAIVLILLLGYGIYSTTDRLHSTFITKETSLKKHTALRTEDPIVSKINKMNLPANEKVWLGSSQFENQLYINNDQATSFTFYMPWIDASPKLRERLINELKSEKPYVIVWTGYENYSYSKDFTNLLRDNYIKDMSAPYFYYRKT